MWSQQQMFWPLLVLIGLSGEALAARRHAHRQPQPPPVSLWQRSGSSSRRPVSLRSPLAASGGGVSGANLSFQTKWFHGQLVDHFSWANQDTWSQRYLVNQDHWCGKNCPILFYAGNEGDIEVFARNTGWMWENAAKLKAMLVFAEHRFYGRSMPYPIDPTQITPTVRGQLGYLSSEQALADYARLIDKLRNELYEAHLSPVLAVGGSYGGMLAAWLRMKYPNAVLGALAGSAPILQFPGEYNCQTFYQIVTRDYENYSTNCSASVAGSWAAIRSLASSPEGRSKLGDLFATCAPVERGQDVETLLQMLYSIWVNMAMTDYANEADFLSRMPALPIKHACAAMSTDPRQLSDEQLVANIAKGSQVYTNYTGSTRCLDIRGLVYDAMDVLWDFQSCTEMVMPICSDGVNDMFEQQPFNLTLFAQECRKRWGVTTQPDKVQVLYGGAQLEGASNIIFSSCSRDPWSAGCPQESVEQRSIHAIKIPGVCHHEDLRASGPNDGEPVKKARQQELNIIGDWIKAHYEQINHTLTWRYDLN